MIKAVGAGGGPGPDRLDRLFFVGFYMFLSVWSLAIQNRIAVHLHDVWIADALGIVANLTAPAHFFHCMAYELFLQSPADRKIAVIQSVSCYLVKESVSLFVR